MNEKKLENLKFNHEILKRLNDEMATLQYLNHFSLLSKLGEAFSPKELPDKLGWTRISTKGNLELHDYNNGLFCVTVKLSGQGRMKDGKFDGVDYHVRFHVGNSDDSSWGAWSKPYEDKEECLAQVNKTAQILNDLVSMPTGEELNDMLQPYGLYGQWEP
jgi:hypothetical protein